MNHANPIASLSTTNNPKVTDECYDLSISNNGKYFATGGSETIVKIWDLDK